MTAEVIPVVDPSKCGMCKGTGHLPGNPEPIPCPQCARWAQVIVEARRDVEAKLRGIADKAKEQLREAHNRYIQESTSAVRVMFDAIEDFKALLKGGK